VIQDVVDGTSKGTDALSVRLANAIEGLADKAADHGDVAALLRQIQLRQHHAAGQPASAFHRVAVRVPAQPPWPNAEEWIRLGFDARVVGGGERILLAPKPWAPTWLDSGDLQVIDDATAELQRRPDRRIPMDPFVASRCPGLDFYASAGQRDAVRAAFLTPPGETTLVNLPTGAGKSLAFQLPALFNADAGRLVLVIVPTTALALDQASRFRELADASEIALPALPLAFHSGLGDDERRSIVQAVRTGQLPILFTSPEACLGALRNALMDAGSRGRIALVAIDEVHSVASWGDGFRPEFQALAGLRDDLLRSIDAHNRFVTLLLTATLTEEAYAVVRDLFGHRADGAATRELHLVAEVALRPEPAYLISQCKDETERRQRLLEVVRAFPRPLLLYVTKPSDARDLELYLRAHGYRRVRSVIGGDMSGRNGEEVLDGWREGVLDIVVATSAFGLGVDASTVRSVVHACVPESIDRFYQEVGRAGRDGKACASLLLWTDSDVAVASDLANAAQMTTEVAMEKWRLMRTWRDQNIVDGVLLVSLDAYRPPYTASSSRNESWNYQVLLRLVRAGLIEFSSLPRREARGAVEDDESYLKRYEVERERDRGRVAVRIREPNASQWPARFDAVRQQTLARQRAEVAAFRELISGTQPLAPLFARTYLIPTLGILPASAPNSCPQTRRTGRATTRAPEPALITRRRRLVCQPALERLFTRLRDGDRLWIVYEPTTAGTPERARSVGEVQRTLTRLAAEGILEFDAADVVGLDAKIWARLGQESPSRFVFSRAGDRDTEGDFPAATVLAADASAEHVRTAALLGRPRHVLIVASTAPDPDHPFRKATTRPHLHISNFARSLD
jgi:ATP-dependent DNA helicase RecQ